MKAHPASKVIVISTLTQRNAEISLKCLSLGAVDYLAKPESARAVGAAAKAKDAIGKSLASIVQKGRISQADGDATLARIEIVDRLDALKPCHVVVEAIVEQLAAKQALFKSLEAIVAEDCILASNTSSLSVTAMASACGPKQQPKPPDPEPTAEPEPPKPPPPKCESLDEKCEGGGGKKARIAGIGLQFEPVGGWVYAQGEKATVAEYLRTLSLSRLYLQNVPHVQSSFVTQGMKICQIGLAMGADDFGSAMLEENVVSSAGCAHPTSIPEIERHIKDAGYVPQRRNMLYQPVDTPATDRFGNPVGAKKVIVSQVEA